YAADHASEEQRQEITGHETADDPDVFEHLRETETLLRGLGLGHLLAEEHDAVEEGRDEVSAELDLPTPAAAEEPADHSAEHEPGRPAGMEDVQIMRAVLREEGRHEGIRDGLQGAVGVGEEEHAPK